jgi:hypothetical protein
VFTSSAAASPAFVGGVEIFAHWNSYVDVRRFGHKNHAQDSRLAGTNSKGAFSAHGRFGSGQYRRWAEAPSMHPGGVWGAFDFCQMPQIACVQRELLTLAHEMA